MMSAVRLGGVLLAAAAMLPVLAQSDGVAHAGDVSAPHSVAPALGRFDDKAIADAVRATAAEMPPLPDEHAAADFRAGPAGGSATLRPIDRAFARAAVPDCLHPDALKLNPPVLNVGGVVIGLAYLFALPHWAYTAASGKCK